MNPSTVSVIKRSIRGVVEDLGMKIYPNMDNFIKGTYSTWIYPKTHKTCNGYRKSLALSKEIKGMASELFPLLECKVQVLENFYNKRYYVEVKMF